MPEARKTAFSKMQSPHASSAHDCLIGSTGFVGGHLLRQKGFAHTFDSRTIGRLADQPYETIVCAAAPGSMFEANRDPEADAARVHALIEQLDRAKAERFVLISSIAVLADFGAGEDEHTARFQSELAYGRHRRELEQFVENRFAAHLIVRLPALFGEGLRKNFIFDLLNPVPSMLTPARLAEIESALEAPLARFIGDLYAPSGSHGLRVLDRAALGRDARRRALEEALIAGGFDASQFHNRETTYQYYDLSRLWRDIEVARGADLSHLHCATEPLQAHAIHQLLTGRDMAQTPARLHREDMHTRHAELWGRTGRYLADAEEVMASLSAFFERQSVPA